MTTPEHAWFKSSYSDAGQNCLEAALLPAAIALRDSKRSAGPVLHLSPTAWRPFLAHLAERGATPS
ncbi:DUF397 domain-containing protein [Streptomyces sp. TRM76130]|nr:DUF397 domain-containing protein [Streptomyces sp. TRM76130]